MNEPKRVTFSDGRSMDVEATGACRCCGRQFSIGYLVGSLMPLGIHAAPACREFERRELLDFLVWNNDAIGRA